MMIATGIVRIVDDVNTSLREGSEAVLTGGSEETRQAVKVQERHMKSWAKRRC